MSAALNAKHDDNEEQLQLSLNSSMRNLPYWNSTLFSSVYLRNDLRQDFRGRWDQDYEDVQFDENGNPQKIGFFHFYNEFRNIAESLRTLKNRKMTETDTITKIIAPVLNALGWYENCNNNVEEPFAAETTFTIKAKPKDKVYRTDLLLVDYPQEAGFINDHKESENRKREARQYCIVPLEAKYWNRITDKEKGNLQEDKKRSDKKGDDVSKTSSFNEQILTYMSILQKKWGIVTDGNIWRLVNREISADSPKRCFEFRLESLLEQESKIESGNSDDSEFLENAKYFYLFFGKRSFVQDEAGNIFVDEVLRESRKYIDVIEEDLKDRFISAMNIMCDGLLDSAKINGIVKKGSEEDLKLVRTVAESHLFNILFIKSCEARGVLPVKAPEYYDISLTSIIDRISVFDPEKYVSKKDKEYIDMRLSKSLVQYKFQPHGQTLYRNLIKLAEIIHQGVKKQEFGFEIKGFKESVFSKKEWEFAKKCSLSDEKMVRILFELGYSKATSSHQKSYQQIPYTHFTPRQLGSIYESFLEFKLDVASVPMVYLKKGKYKQWTTLTASLQKKLKGYEPVVNKGQLYFTPDNKDRKETGSYYTPDYIVSYIVSNALSPLCEGRTSSEILDLKICDPAMGSGHFLISSLNYLANQYLSALEREKPESELPAREDAIRTVLDKCIYGADINPRAVKLAKMSLWLESAHWGRKLERLDDQLVESNSLTQNPIWKEQPQLMSGGFDAIVGNPPYIGEKNNAHIFQPVKSGRLKSYCQARMDLWYVFACLSIDLIRDGGYHSFIATQNWITNEGGAILRRKIAEETQVLSYIDFGDFKVFDSASIQTMIYLLKKDSLASNNSTKYLKIEEKDLSKEGIINLINDEESFDNVKVDTDDIVSAIRFSSLKNALVEKRVLSNRIRHFSDEEIGNGIDVLQDFVSKSHLKKLGSGFKKGQGIFVLTEKEKRSVATSALDKAKLKPYYTTNELSGFSVNLKPRYHIIYADKEVRSNISKYPGIKSHLDKFKTVLTSAFKPYGLNRPREEHWFSEGERIFSVRKTSIPSFSLVDFPCYVSRAFLIIKPKDWNEDINYIQGILSSDLTHYWLTQKGKLQGSQLQIDMSPIKSIPIKTIDFSNKSEKSLHDKVVKVVKKLQADSSSQDFSSELNHLINSLYGLSEKEIGIVKDHVSKRKANAQTTEEESAA